MDDPSLPTSTESDGPVAGPQQGPQQGPSEPPGTAPTTVHGDVELVGRARAGDAEAIREIGERLQVLPRLITVANQRMVSPLPPHEVADIAQETFLTIWQKLETYQGGGTLEAWAWNFGVFLLKNRVRRVTRQRHLAGGVLEDVHAAPEDPKEAMRYGPDEIEAALEQLPHEMKEAIHLKHDDGLMFKEIAARLKIAESTVKTRYYRGLSRMQEALASDHRSGGGSK